MLECRGGALYWNVNMSRDMSDATLLFPEMILPVPAPESLRSGAGIAVIDDRVAALEAPDALRARWPRATVIDLPGCLLLPGLVNAHQHGRGISQVLLGHRDNFLEVWIAGRRAKGILDPYPITKLAAANMLANGVTTTIHANYTYGSGAYEDEVRASLRVYPLPVDEPRIRTPDR